MDLTGEKALKIGADIKLIIYNTADIIQELDEFTSDIRSNVDESLIGSFICTVGFYADLSLLNPKLSGGGYVVYMEITDLESLEIPAGTYKTDLRRKDTADKITYLLSQYNVEFKLPNTRA